MSDVVERVSLAIENILSDVGENWPGFRREMARAAILAMRDLGEDFIWNAVHDRKPMLDCIRGHDLGGDEAEKVYHAVIDAALAAR